MTASIAESSEERRTRLALDLAQHALLVLTVVLRPFVFGGDLAAADQVVWHGLVLGGWLLCLLELWSRRRSELRWGHAGLAAGLLLLVLLPAAARAPDPALGWGRWASWASLLLWAAWLLQVLPGRRRFAWSLLVGTLAVEAVLALVQQQHVLPAMAAAMAQGDAAMVELEQRVGSGDVADRIGHGGTYGSMTLANILAAWLLVVAVPLLGSLVRGVAAWRQGLEQRPRSDALVLGCLVAGLALAALLTTGARGAPAALVCAAAVVALRWWSGPKRVLPLLGLVVLAGIVLATPALREPVQASIDVRLGYWRAAVLALGGDWLLGAGIGAFEHLAPQYLRPGDEFSRFAHNELLEGLLAGGLLVATAMAWWMWRLLWSRPTVAEVEEAPTAAAAWVGRLRWLPVLVFPYMLLFGTFASDNLAWWPGGDGPLIALWAAALGLVLAWIAGAAARLPLPPPWAWQLALATGVLACLLDFQLHDLSFAGTLVLVACLAGSPGARRLPASTALRAGVSTVGVAAAAVFAFGALRAADLRAADDTGRLLDGFYRAAGSGDPAAAWPWFHDLTLVAGAPPPAAQRLPPPPQQGAVLLAAWRRAADAVAGWPPSPERAVDLAHRHPDPQQRLALLQAALERRPGQPDAWSLLARGALEARHWGLAIEAAREATARYPAQLRHRALLVQALEAAAEHRPGQAEALRAEAAAIRVTIERDLPGAHARHRVPRPASSPGSNEAPSMGPPAR